MSTVMAAFRLLEAGRAGEAETACRDALRAAPDDVDLLHVLALARLRLGFAFEAAALLADVRKRQPKSALAAYNHALALQQAGETAGAVAAYRDAIKLEPADADAHYNLGVALRAAGKPDQAAQSYRKAIALRPNFSAAHNNLGNLLRDLGKDAAAMESYRAALAHDRSNVQAHVNVATTAHRLGDDLEAELHFDSAVALAPAEPEARLTLADGLIETGRVQAAFTVLAPHLAGAPMTDDCWRALARCLRAETPAAVDDRMSGLLERLLDHPAVAPLDIAPALSRYLARCAPLTEYVTALPDDAVAAAKALSRMPLLLKTLALTPIPDRDLEAVFTALRRGLLDAAARGGAPDDALPFAAALALQAFTNEYVYDVADDELAAIAKLAEDAATPFALAIIACYRPLTSLGRDLDLLDQFRDGPLAPVIARQIAEPNAECDLATGIPTLTPIGDGVSSKVRAQYEANPYPRWIKPALPGPAASLEGMLAAPPLSFEVQDLAAGEAPRILIAGCGTGQHAAMVAARFPKADILAVDLSRASLAYAARACGTLGLANVRFAQADILAMGGLAERFDLIESVGVLHHLAEPAAGWRVLTGLLRPRGVMKIGLYSERARTDVTTVAAALKAAGFTADADGIRHARAFIRARADLNKAAMATADEAAMAAMPHASDFYTMSEMRDLLFHVQESRLTLPAIKQLLDTLGLHFLGFEIGDADVLAEFRKAFPSPRALRSLSDWDAFEQTHPATFREMYQFWCQKK